MITWLQDAGACKNLTGQVKKEQIEAHETENFMHNKGNTVEQTDSVEKMCASDPSDRGLTSIVYIFKLQKKSECFPSLSINKWNNETNG